MSDRWASIRAEALPKAGRFAKSYFRTQQTRDAAEAGYMRGYLAGATRTERRGHAKRCTCIEGENCSDCSRPTKPACNCEGPQKIGPGYHAPYCATMAGTEFAKRYASDETSTSLTSAEEESLRERSDLMHKPAEH